MTKDPYEVLGVSRDATDDEIKDAYRREAKKYHPDNYMNSPLADLAKEKMQEVNEAYDTIRRQRKSVRANSYTNDYSYNSSSNSRFFEIRKLVNSREFSRADELLEAIAVSERNAEWFFLKGCVYISKGWYFEAEAYFIKATEMDPANAEYKEALNALHIRTERFERRAKGSGREFSGSCTACDICTGLLCADCCCECLGGDIIRCC